MFKLVALTLAMVVSATTLAGQLSGGWTLTLDPDFGGREQARIDCTFTTKGEQLTGACGGSAPITGEIRGEQVRFEVKTGEKNELTATFIGALDQAKTKVSGAWTLTDASGKRDGKFTLQRR